MIITGLYLVLWGKSKDQLLVKPESDKISSGKQQMTATTGEEGSKSVQSSQEFTALDVGKEDTK